MSCQPGDPCYDAYYQPNSNCGCDSDVCVNSDHVNYIGPNLPCTGINNVDTLTWS